MLLDDDEVCRRDEHYERLRVAIGVGHPGEVNQHVAGFSSEQLRRSHPTTLGASYGREALARAGHFMHMAGHLLEEAGHLAETSGRRHRGPEGGRRGGRDPFDAEGEHM